MMMPPMGPPTERSWEEFVDELKIQIANTEKSLLMAKAQLKEAESHVEKKD